MAATKNPSIGLPILPILPIITPSKSFVAITITIIASIAREYYCKRTNLE
ncbi:hypothetical protein VN0127_06150 [Helicobacter pylori]